jgi:hypothetical protein
MATALMEVLGVPDGPIKFAINPPVEISKSNLTQKFEDVVLDGCLIPALGFMFIPKKSKFHFTKNSPGYKWINGRQDYINHAKMIKTVMQL